MLFRIIAYVLILTTTAANFWRIGYYAAFNANRSELSQNFCINKNRPWLHCNGKCYLAKKIKAAEEKERRQSQLKQLSNYVEALPVQGVTACCIWRTKEKPAIADLCCSVVDGYYNRLRKPPGSDC